LRLPSKPRTIILLSLLAASGTIARFTDPGFVIDDAWISFRVARNWLESGVLAFDLAGMSVEATTSFLWTILSAAWIAALPSIDPVFMARCLGACFFFLTIVLSAVTATRCTPAHFRSQAVLAVGLTLGLSGNLAYHALSGMETALYVLLVVLSLDIAGRVGDSPQRAYVGGLILGLLGMTRPEGILAGCVILILLVARGLRLRTLLQVALPFVLLIGGLEVFRWQTYGSLVPNTFHAKPPHLMSGLQDLGGFLLGVGVLSPVLLLPAAARDSKIRALLVFAAIMAVASAATGGDWMPGYRRFFPAYLALIIGLGRALACATDQYARLQRCFALLGFVCILLGNTGMAITKRDGAWYPTEAWGKLGEVVRATPGINTVALSDIGRFGWEYRGSIFDFAGLVDGHIARLPGQHMAKQWDEDYFRARSPDLVVLASQTKFDDPLTHFPVVRLLEEPVLDSIWVNGGYRFHASIPTGAAHLLVFKRNGIELPQALWGPESPRDFRAIVEDLLVRERDSDHPAVPVPATANTGSGKAP
jgi:arabinofuranosyltransferase